MKIKHIPFMIEDHLQSCPICLFKDYKHCPKFIELYNDYSYLIEYEEN
jgi:hypothetical protein